MNIPVSMNMVMGYLPYKNSSILFEESFIPQCVGFSMVFQAGSSSSGGSSFSFLMISSSFSRA